MSEPNQAGFGAALRRRREELKLSLDDVAASTRVRKTYLQALEEENLQALPGNAYAIGFLRIYARHIGLPIAPLLNSFSGIEPEEGDEALPVSGSGHSRLPRKSKRKGRGGRWFLLLLLGLLGLAVLAYLKGWVPGTGSRQETVPPAPAVQMPTPQQQPQALPQPPATLQSGVPSPSQGQPEIVFTELPVLPAEGAVVRMLPVSAGVIKVSLDSQEQREYQLQVDQSLNWKVTGSLACELSAPGLVRVWIDQQEIPVAEYPAFTLRAGSPQEQRP